VDIADLARKHGPKAIEIVARLMTHDKDSKVRLAAAVALLDRGFGRPKQEIETTANGTIELHLVAARIVSGELLATVSEPPTIEHAAVASDTDVPTE
jgi:CRP-like cAMP-binding protein